jgi:hypothetical protein
MRLQGGLEQTKTGLDEHERGGGVDRCREVRLPFSVREAPYILA